MKGPTDSSLRHCWPTAAHSLMALLHMPGSTDVQHPPDSPPQQAYHLPAQPAGHHLWILQQAHTVVWLCEPQAALEPFFFDAFAVFLNGKGTITHILNDKGAETSKPAGETQTQPDPAILPMSVAAMLFRSPRILAADSWNISSIRPGC